MVLVDELLRWEGGNLDCEARVQGGGPFVRDGVASPALVVELMAQAAACAAGLAGRSQGGPAKGFLLGTRELALDGPAIRVGEVLTIRVRTGGREGNAATFEGEVFRGGERVAAASLLVYEGDPGAIDTVRSGSA